MVGMHTGVASSTQTTNKQTKKQGAWLQGYTAASNAKFALAYQYVIRAATVQLAHFIMMSRPV